MDAKRATRRRFLKEGAASDVTISNTSPEVPEL